MYILLLMRFVKEEKAMDQKAIIRAVCISERKGEQCAAVCSTGTGLAAVCKTSHRSQISFQRAENVHYFDLPSRMTEPVSAAFSPETLKDPGADKLFYNDFQVFFRYFLAFGDFIQRNISVALILCQIDKNTQGITAAS